MQWRARPNARCTKCGGAWECKMRRQYGKEQALNGHGRCGKMYPQAGVARRQVAASAYQAKGRSVNATTVAVYARKGRGGIW